jgi:hypothetical protein
MAFFLKTKVIIQFESTSGCLVTALTQHSWQQKKEKKEKKIKDSIFITSVPGC